MLMSVLLVSTMATAHAARPTNDYPVQVARSITDDGLAGMEKQEKQNDVHLLEKKGWDRRADKYVRTSRGTYDSLVRQYEMDQKGHASTARLKEDQARIEDAKRHLDAALEDERRSQRSVNQDQALNRKYESTLKQDNYQAAEQRDKRADNIVLEKQGWDRRANKYIVATQHSYDQIARQYEMDLKRHASASQLNRDKVRLNRAKQKLDIALADHRRAQSALVKADTLHGAAERAERNTSR